MNTLTIVKIGGNIIDDEAKLALFLTGFAKLPGDKILVHGGGKLATSLANQLGVEQKMIDGRRVTDAETLKIVTMVYAGYINKNIVSALNAQGCHALGLSGSDGNLMVAHQRAHPSIDFGFVGDIDGVNVNLVHQFLGLGLTMVIAPITSNSKGQLLNTNADTIAQTIATAMAKEYQVSLIYSFEKPGVLMDVSDEQSLIIKLNEKQYLQLKASEKIFAGMIPKLDNAFSALNAGVSKVIIGNALDLPNLLAGTAGTTLQYD